MPEPNTLPFASAWTVGAPLTAPSLAAAMGFLATVLPDTVLGSALRSEQGYIAMYRKASGAADPVSVTIRGKAAIRRYLEAQLLAPLADHWFSAQITQYTDLGSNVAEKARHIVQVVLDLDGDRMAPEVQRLRTNDLPAFWERLDLALAALGIGQYHLVASSPGGLHLHLPLVNSKNGRLLGANEKTLNDWKRTVDGLRSALTDFGPDKNAVRPTQPFVIPGLPRLKHPGFIPYYLGGRSGPATDLYALLNGLVRLRYAQPERRAHLTLHRGTKAEFLAYLLKEIIHTARSFAEREGRNVAAHRIAAYLLAKGATRQQAWEAMSVWNARNTPPLTDHELDKCLSSAETDRARPGKATRWAQMAAAPWNKTRALLGLPPVARRSPRQSRARAREERQRDHYGEVAERALRYIRDQQTVTMKQEELADLLATNRSTLRIILQNLQEAGTITITPTRGRYGKTVVTYVQPGEAQGTPGLSLASPSLRDNVQSAPLNPGDVACSRPPGGSIPCAGGTFSPGPLVGHGAGAVGEVAVVAPSGGGCGGPGGLLHPPGVVVRRAVRLAQAAGLLACRGGLVELGEWERRPPLGSRRRH